MAQRFIWPNCPSTLLHNYDSFVKRARENDKSTTRHGSITLIFKIWRKKQILLNVVAGKLGLNEVGLEKTEPIGRLIESNQQLLNRFGNSLSIRTILHFATKSMMLNDMMSVNFWATNGSFWKWQMLLVHQSEHLPLGVSLSQKLR